MSSESDEDDKYNPPENYHDLRFQRMTDITDWSGQILRKGVLKLLEVSCIVRCLTYLYDNDGQFVAAGGEYYKITKIKDGTIWGTSQGLYRCCDFFYPTIKGKEYSFRFNNISEVPIMWQPKRLRRKMKKYLVPNLGYVITGMRD